MITIYNKNSNMKKVLSLDEKVEIYEKEILKKRKEYVLSKEFDELSWDFKREYLIYENNNTCFKCGINEWMGCELSIEINHINGNNTDHSKENLECLCPNCHSTTKNWRGRNKTKKRFKISNKELLRVMIKNDWNFRKSLIEVGLTPKGGNYKRCHQIKGEYESFGKILSEINLIPILTKEEFREVFNKFETHIEVAEFLGVSLNTIKRWSKEFGLRRESKSKIPKKEIIIDDFYRLKTFTSVGRKYGVSDNAVRKWCKKYNILEICKNIK